MTSFKADISSLQLKVVEILCDEPEFILSSHLDAFGLPTDF